MNLFLFKNRSFRLPWYWYLAWKHIMPTGGKVSFLGIVGIVGVMLGVMVLAIVQMVMNGFGHTLTQKIIDTNGHICVESGDIIYDSKKILETISMCSGVDAVTAYAQGVVMVEHANIPAFPYIRGIDMRSEKQVMPLDHFMLDGDWRALDDESVLVSSQLAIQLRVRVGDMITVYTPLMLDRLKNDELLLPKELEVVGIFETGWNEVDGRTLISTLSLMQDLYGMDRGIHGIAVRLEAEYDEETIAQKMNVDFKDTGYRAYTWLEMDKDLLFILRIEKATMFFIILMIVVIAAFSITGTLMTTVIKKTREISLYRAMGATRREVLYCFILQGFLIGFLGTLMGVGLAIVGLYFRNDIVSFFSKITHGQSAFLKYYQFVEIPVHHVWSDWGIIIICGVGMATVAGVWPAWKAMKLNPAEGLKYE